MQEMVITSFMIEMVSDSFCPAIYRARFKSTMLRPSSFTRKMNWFTVNPTIIHRCIGFCSHHTVCVHHKLLAERTSPTMIMSLSRPILMKLTRTLVTFITS